MTTQEKIDVLERAIEGINTCIFPPQGICWMLSEILNISVISQPEQWLRENIGAKMPPAQFYGRNCDEPGFCWPIGLDGDEQRREFLQSHINRLKKEL